MLNPLFSILRQSDFKAAEIAIAAVTNGGQGVVRPQIRTYVEIGATKYIGLAEQHILDVLVEGTNHEIAAALLIPFEVSIKAR